MDKEKYKCNDCEDSSTGRCLVHFATHTSGYIAQVCEECQKSTGGTCNLHSTKTIVTGTVAWPNYPVYGQVWSQQGWQCPVCRACYSPLCYQCFNCRGNSNITLTTGTNGNPTSST